MLLETSNKGAYVQKIFMYKRIKIKIRFHPANIYCEFA